MNCKLIILFTVFLAIYIFTACEASSVCDRPKDFFQDIKHVHDYLECVKSQASTRYGKRALPTLLGKLRPDLFDYDYNLQQIQDLLYADN